MTHRVTLCSSHTRPRAKSAGCWNARVSVVMRPGEFCRTRCFGWLSSNPSITSPRRVPPEPAIQGFMTLTNLCVNVQLNREEWIQQRKWGAILATVRAGGAQAARGGRRAACLAARPPRRRQGAEVHQERLPRRAGRDPQAPGAGHRRRRPPPREIRPGVRKLSAVRHQRSAALSPKEGSAEPERRLPRADR